ncbi:unnamed protein product [Diatraea saccharalis]|uniref:Uncharacterized protein n=1 Tax=Diatraea saccharalis TaxID=40085 RepID=A0A9N9WDI0_9NEOP|nr:unnamed protein product [Diatraea saccharalis]
MKLRREFAGITIWPPFMTYHDTLSHTVTEEEVPIIDTLVDNQASCSTSKKPFLDLSDNQKKRRSLTLLDYTEEELLYALCFKLKESNKAILASIIKELSQNEEKCEIVSDVLFTVKTVKTVKPCLPDNKALALVTSLNLSKWQYLNLRSILASDNIFGLPSYHKLLDAKKRFYPPETDIIVTESEGIKQSHTDNVEATVNKQTYSTIN